MSLNRKLFPTFSLGLLDYSIGVLLLAFCYVAFVQATDLRITGENSLSYLFGHVSDFYEYGKRTYPGVITNRTANYPPPIYAIFAAWLYPFKLFGLLKSPAYFPFYWAYWLKTLTSLVYVATGLVFYRVTQRYHADKTWGKYATWLWLTIPLALFSQFIFSQYNIFHLFLTLIGFLFFIKKRIFLASFLFGVSVTFKYFPFFVFVPLLFLFEKKILCLIFSDIIFSIPTLLIFWLYGHSPSFIEGVRHFSPISRVFSSVINVGDAQIYYLVALYSILVGIAYSLEESTLEIAAYIFLVSSVLPFLFIYWNPQWLLFITPAVALTTVLDLDKKNTQIYYV